MNPAQENAIIRLRDRFPWPERMPPVSEDLDLQGWLTVPTAEMLAEWIRFDMVVLEIGAWHGKSTTFISDMLQFGYLISVDTWAGKVEIPTAPVKDMFHLWQANCWEFREKLTGIKASSQSGIAALASLGLVPDLVYLDGAHTYEAVLLDLRAIHLIFPKAHIIGDDFHWREPGTGKKHVADAVEVFTRSAGLEYQTNAYAFHIIPKDCNCRGT